jgi:hypothetical protein
MMQKILPARLLFAGVRYFKSKQQTNTQCAANLSTTTQWRSIAHHHLSTLMPLTSLSPPRR